MRRALLALALLLAACSSHKDATPISTTQRDLGQVVVAAGDIVCPLSLSCVDTSGLVLALEPDAVLALGDLQYERGELEDFRNVYDKSWGRFKDITHPTPGNHEYSTPGAAGYFTYFGQKAPWYSFDIGEWHAISLNSNCRSVGGCGPGSPQSVWLTADLAAHPATCTLAFWHNPRWSSGLHGSDDGYDHLWSLLSTAHAELVLGAHDHHYERFAPDRGIRQFVVGTGGRSVYPVLNPEKGSEVSNHDTFGVLKLTLRSASYAWEFVPAADAKFTDSGETRCL